MARYGYISHSELAHHGILGQKWGVRRYQNADGSLTEEGKRHYKIYQNYQTTADKFNNMAKQMEKNKALRKDKNFMNEYVKAGRDIDSFYKGSSYNSIRIGKKINGDAYKSYENKKADSIRSNFKNYDAKITKVVNNILKDEDYDDEHWDYGMFDYIEKAFGKQIGQLSDDEYSRIVDDVYSEHRRKVKQK